MTRDARRGRRSDPRSAPPDPAFPCAGCGRIVPVPAPGTRHRNHCPWCLESIHVDVRPGDRRSGCRARMEAIAVAARRDGEWALVHRCRGCGKVVTNRIAGDDDETALVTLAMRPLVRPAFPLGSIRLSSVEGRG